MLNTIPYKTVLLNNLKRLYKLYFDYRLACLEKKKFSVRLKKARSRVKQFFFISGAPKSGTTWLRMMLNAHPQIIATAEAACIGPEFRSVNSGTTWLNMMLNANPQIIATTEPACIGPEFFSITTWFCEENFKSWTEMDGVKYGSGILKGIDQTELINHIKRSMIEAVLLAQWKPPACIIGDKTPLSYCQNPELLKDLFPNSKLINIIRDGRDVAVSSHFHLLRTKNYSMFKNHASGEQARQCFVEGERVSCELFDDHSLPAVADVWGESVKGGRRAKGIFGQNYYEVKYENLANDPMIIKDIFEFLGVSTSKLLAKYCVDKGKFERLSRGREKGQDDPNSFYRKGIVGDWKNYLYGKYKEIYKELNGQLLIDLGYEKDNDW